MCGNRCEAAAADCRHARRRDLDPPRGLRVAGGRHELLLADPHLQRERALTGLRKDLVRFEAVPDLRREAEPVEAARLEHYRVQAALYPFAEPGVDVSAQ